MKIVYTDWVQPDLELEERILAAAGMALVAAEPQCQTAADVIRVAEDAEALIVLYAPITHEVFAALPHLRIISLPLVGVDAVDLEAAREHGVWVAYVPDACVPEVGVHAVAMALALVRHLPFYDRAVREGRWDYEEPGVLHRPTHLTFGLLGCGRIARQAGASAAPSFGRVLAYDPYVPAENWPDGIERAPNIETLFRDSDVISLHAPIVAETRHIVDTALLARMKPGSYLVNAARGGLVDPGALLNALDSGQLAGAALDVFEPEPPDMNDPLLHHARVMVTPHAAYYSVEGDEEGRGRAVHNIIDFARCGRPNDFVVTGTK